MPRPFTLFTGQWADLPLEEVCRLARDFGYDGLELACWGDHFEVDKALADPGYVDSRHQLLDKYGLKCWAVSNHLVGQAVCDALIDERHRAILPADVWGDGDPEGCGGAPPTGCATPPAPRPPSASTPSSASPAPPSGTWSRCSRPPPSR